MSMLQARRAAESGLDLAHVRVLTTQSASLQLFFDLLQPAGTGGNLSTNALIAALAQEHGGTVHSNDVDFVCFPNIVCRNPLP